ncbi:expressed unknown protein [Seminavis robusta]|uniref:Uncharacterized protein n=1 Tax=Seminavis robusta TaxID=568900 RepID=A0A9N8DKC4_9STRA|nr:expressed unknown protein [Seminavis robusta]|eukprot:Sro206_g086410.1 n/a (485) ;mRNA; r:5340-6794
MPPRCLITLASSITLLAVTVSAQTSTCSNTNTGACDWEPFNPVICGPDRSCSYENFCLARENGYDIDTDCCQAPQPSVCPFIFAPVVCGDQQCEYSNSCVAELAGYSDDQCELLPPECPTGTADCSGAPSNPFKCGPSKDCLYDTICDLQSAGFDMDLDCCQDVRTDTACTDMEVPPVSCGPPHKQCPYESACEAFAAGYNENQCCGFPDANTACILIYAPVNCGFDKILPCSFSNMCQAEAAGFDETECCPAVTEGPSDAICTADLDPQLCGPNECQYGNLCEANSAGWTDEDCCPQGTGVCTTLWEPVKCGTCEYSNQGCAELAGFSAVECCKQPLDPDALCTADYRPLACSTANCIYDNACIADLAGFDPNSCVVVPPQEQGGSTTSVNMADGGGSDAASGNDALTPVVSDAGNVTAEMDDGEDGMDSMEDEMEDPETNDEIEDGAGGDAGPEPLKSSDGRRTKSTIVTTIVMAGLGFLFA